MMRQFLAALFLLPAFVSSATPVLAQNCQTLVYYRSIVPALDGQVNDFQSQKWGVENEISNWQNRDPFGNVSAVQILLKTLRAKRDKLASDITERLRVRDMYMRDAHRCYNVLL